LTTESNLRHGHRVGRGDYKLQADREVRCAFSRRLNVSNGLDSLTVAGKSFRMVAADKLQKRPT